MTDEDQRAIWLRVVILLLKVVWNLAVVCTPLLGFWIASSLATYFNGPFWVPLVAGIAAFPVVPLLWEGIGKLRFDSKVQEADEAGDDPPQRYLTFWDRFILRTLTVNFAFLGVLAVWFPQDSFTALSTRGDWMLDGRDGAWVEPTRRTLFWTASTLEILYNATRENPFDQGGETPGPDPGDQPAPDGEGPSTDGDTSGEDGGAADDAGRATADERPNWPLSEKRHPAVKSIPASSETDIASVADYIDKNEDDPHREFKAVYDWVADNIAYDAEALAAGRPFPPQDPQTVFQKRKAVCAGYAKLVEALGEKLGYKVAYIAGVSRENDGDLAGGGHAWNAVRIEKKWYLLDATWGAGSVQGDTFEKDYNPNYLYTPPKIFGLDHFPDDPRWQLLGTPMSRGEFMRQPILRPGFYRRDLQLVDPTRSQVTVYGDITIELKNPDEDSLIAEVRKKGAGHDAGTRCRTRSGASSKITCPVDASGSYVVTMFGQTDDPGKYEGLGHLQFNRR